MMRNRFDEQLEDLKHGIIEMGSMIEKAISDATEALLDQDADRAREIIDSDEVIDNKEKEIEALCLNLMISQQPVARDFRQISAALKMITDMERIGDHASDISELTVYLSEQPYIKELEHIAQMAKETQRMLKDSLDSFVTSDTELAQAAIARDDIVDGLFVSVRQELIQLVHKDAGNGEQAFDLLQIAKYYERIGDHAENIAEWVIFSMTGVHKDKRVL